MSAPSSDRLPGRMLLVVLSAGLLFGGISAVQTAMAGPNAGGTLVVHDTGLAYTTDSASYPSPPPTSDPPTVDNNLPSGTPADAPGWVWKVYAAFPPAANPRLKALVLGEQFGAGVLLLAGGLPSADDFEITQNGWPTTSGGGVGLSFMTVKTDLMVECYWFGGYGYGGAIWAAAPHPTQTMVFVDDAVPPHEDAIAGLSTIGFGVDGHTVYPALPAAGACCFPDGHCETLPETDCPAVWYGADSVCDPNPCPPPEGACCHPNGTCTFVAQEHCSDQWLGFGSFCFPNPCPQLPGACCYTDGLCEFVPQSACPTGDWRQQVPCSPSPCPQPQPFGACCYADGYCESLQQVNCTGMWYGANTVCSPNPCLQPGGEANAGGVLVVHDTGLAYTFDTSSYPSEPPATCDDVDNIARPDSFTVWKVYAVFPEENSPRLKALAFGENFNPGQVTVFDGGLPSAFDFEIAQNGWPNTPGGGVGISFGQTQTSHVVEVYWFGGFGTQGGRWSTAPHPVQETIFVDDAQPPHENAIAGLGSLGFGLAGDTPCGHQSPNGACCFVSGSCTMLFESVCGAAGGTFYGGECVPNPCPQPPPVGACCFPDGSCQRLGASECTTAGGAYVGGTCLPNPCPQPPPGACCYPDGHCVPTTQSGCPTGAWFPATPCVPNPCPADPLGACCYANGQCIYTYHANCPSGNWLIGVPCTPSPCPPPAPTGACCIGQSCILTPEVNCGGIWLGIGTDCMPNPCCGRVPDHPSPPPDGRVATSAGPGQGIIAQSPRTNPCPGSTLHQNDDGSFEDGFAWLLGGVVPPDYGAVAEGYTYSGLVCGLELELTAWGAMSGEGTIDAYVWESDGCNPANVLSLTTGIHISAVGAWPTITTYDLDTDDCFAGGDYFVGYWGNWPGEQAGFGVATDTDGPGGLPRTKIAPGIGYPEGWQDINLVLWSPIEATGIRAFIGPGAVPTTRTTWGRIKAMYH